MLSFKNVHFIYEPYPIGVARGVFEESFYDELVSSFPPAELFNFMAHLGNKYSLSELNNPDAYHEYVRSSRPWHEFYKWIKRDEFPVEILTMLCEHKIDLDLRVAQGNNTAVPMRTLLQKLRRLRSRHSGSNLSARFEFSMLPADGGFIRPHTDSPQKIVTLVIGILRQGEWNPSFGGGTEVLRPKDTTNNFNFKNSYLEFEDVETLTTFEYSPNNCVIFIKTFNSLHAVRPMTAPGHSLMRKTLTINIEKV
ncbi:MAG TPA: hypothetical protein VGQ39_20775 [Pyrinomonadaceae bacterium]|jgi:hypothetical protein|nr:hypothetical protein [Pyrinomonadaceae bacterium]